MLDIIDGGEVLAEADDEDVVLTWEPETTEGLLGYDIYRKNVNVTDWADAEYLGTIEAESLDIPTDLAITPTGFLTWEKTNRAIGYEVYIDDDRVETDRCR